MDDLTDERWLEGQVALFPTKPPQRLISDYVENRRIMPEPIPGPWRNAYTPYLVEVMDDLSPYSSVQHEVLMCAAQIGKTAAAENVAAYWMDENPTAVLFVSGTEDLAEKWATQRLEPMIDSLGFRHKIGATHNAPKSRRSGDKTFSKEFVGGALHIVSAQSAGGIASLSKRVLIRDEIDRAPPEMRTGEGNWLSVSEARTNAWGDRRKIFDCSTPTDYDTSEINRLYELGDCRLYYVPCPHCQAEQMLEMGDGKSWGLKVVEKEGRLVDVVYLCKHCHRPIKEHQKQEMLQRGRWIASKPSSDPFLVSRHINALYSPVGMYSWRKIWQHHQEAQKDPSQMKAFVTLDLGLPYKEPGTRPALDLILDHRGTYHVGEIRPGMLYLTAGVDVQEGKEHPETPDEGPRLEMEVLAHGEDYRTWSVIYKKFYGSVDDPYSGAWEEFYQWCANPDPAIHKGESTTFLRDDATRFPLWGIFVDSGTFTDVVYRFCSRAQVFYPSKGAGWVTDAKFQEKGDVAGPMNFRHYRVARVPNSDKELFELSTNYYKGELYSRLKVPRQPLEPQNPGYCDFPVDDPPYSKEYFDQLRAEERRRDGSFHRVKTRNEALDCRVYAMAAGEVYLMGEVTHRREVLKKAGGNEAQMRLITPKWLLSQWAASLWGENRR